MVLKPITKNEIVNALHSVDLTKGHTVMVHTALSKMGYVCGGAQTVIEALIEVVGEDGTIMMPTQSWKNLDPEDGVHWTVPEEYWQIIRDNWPAYDKRITPTNTMVAAWGKHAEYLVNDHDLSNIFGEGSPIGKLYELNGEVLLIGVGYDKNTSLHLADVRADYPGKHNSIEHSAIMESGKRVWKEYETLFVDGEDFDQIGEAFEQSNAVNKAMIGNAELRLMNQKRLVDFAVDWIQKYRRG